MSKALAGSLDAVLESEAYKRFYMHRTSHWLGRDVHDAGDYKDGGEWKRLAPGMVLTIEPGCYVRPADDVPPTFWNIGVRIEDDILVTRTGHEFLSEVPKDINDCLIASDDQGNTRCVDGRPAVRIRIVRYDVLMR